MKKKRRNRQTDREKKQKTKYEEKRRNNRIDRIVMPFIKSCNSVDWMQRGGETEGGGKRQQRER